MRPTLAFLAPLLPAASGNGLAMRTLRFLEAAARRHEVHLFVAPVSGGALEPSAQVRALCASVRVLPLAEPPTDGLLALLRDPRTAAARLLGPACEALALALPALSPAAVHVQRLYLAPLLEGGLAALLPRPRVTLDLDDVESMTRARLAVLLRARGAGQAAALEHAESLRYAALEQRLLPALDRVFVTSEHDCAALAARLGLSNLAVVPNGVPLPAHAADPAAREEALLFVGNLSYLPNADAAVRLAREIVPRVRALLGRPVPLWLVGSSPGEEVLALAAEGAAEVYADVPDVAPFLARARVAVQPLLAGGGTRLKMLEAFAHGLPVVASALAAEGLEATPGAEFLLAEGAADTAAACARLLEDPTLAARLAAAGQALVARRYDARVVVDLLEGHF